MDQEPIQQTPVIKRIQNNQSELQTGKGTQETEGNTKDHCFLLPEAGL